MAGWTLSELTEFELRLRRSGAAELSETPSAPRPVLFRNWLQQQRVGDPEPERLVTAIRQGERLLAAGMALLAFLAGLGAVKALLVYDGTRLINVSTFLVAMVFGQIGLLLLLFVSKLLFRRSLADLYQRLPLRVPELADSRRLREIWTLHGFVRLQTFATAFNLGALIGAALEGITRDLAFGWGTTLRVEAGQVHRLVSLLSRPWGGAYTPTPLEIEQSRILLLRGAEGVDPVSAAAWWPFLLLCLAVYGLLPRLLLALGAWIGLRRSLARPDFTDVLCERLYLRLTRPPLDFSRGPLPAEGEGPAPDATALPAFEPPGPVVLLADPELGEGSCLAAQIEQRLSLRVQNHCSSPSELDSPPAGGVLWLLEGWCPPIQEHLETARRIRRQAGSEAFVLLLLVGLPSEEGALTPPRPDDADLWRRHFAPLRDPRLGLLPMPAP